RPPAHRHDAAARAAGAGSRAPGAAQLGDDVPGADAGARASSSRPAHRRRGAPATLVPPAQPGVPSHPRARRAAPRGMPYHHQPLVPELPVPDQPSRAALPGMAGGAEPAPELRDAPPLPPASPVALARRALGAEGAG